MIAERFHTASHDASVESLLARELPRIAKAVTGLDLPGFAGLVLGGGYGRGEGGAWDGRPSNDLDFFVLSDLPEARLGEIAQRLEPVSKDFTERLGVDVDFTVRTASRIRLDRRRLMVQELLRGHVVLAPTGFNLSAWAGIEELPAEEVPVSEAARLLMNRGMGLVLAAARLRSATPTAEDLQFIIRNINKAVLGAGDVRLIATRRYAWSVVERASRLGDPDYGAAVSWKFTPGPVPADELATRWNRARDGFLRAAEELESACSRDISRRSVYQLLRWFKRRRSMGDVRSWGMDCTVRVARKVVSWLKGPDAASQDAPQGLFRDWHVFN